MNTIDCIRSRRSIRKFKADKVSPSELEKVIAAASFSPSWKNTQITRYILVENDSLKSEIISSYVSPHNASIIANAPHLMAVTFIKNRCGFERDGSYTTSKGDHWQMFDAGVACQTFALAAHEYGIGTVIMGVFDDKGIEAILDLPDTQELAALITFGYPDEEPEAPARKTVADLLTYK